MVIEWDVSLIDDSQVDFYKDKKKRIDKIKLRRNLELCATVSIG